MTMLRNWSTKDEIETSICTFQSVRDEFENTFSKLEWRDDGNGRENLYYTLAIELHDTLYKEPQCMQYFSPFHYFPREKFMTSFSVSFLPPRMIFIWYATMATWIIEREKPNNALSMLSLSIYVPNNHFFIFVLGTVLGNYFARGISWRSIIWMMKMWC